MPAVRNVIGTRTPEELETLFEDSLMIGDRDALGSLFADGSVLVVSEACSARGIDQIVQLALTTWSGDRCYVADPGEIVQARDIALIVAADGINVARRGPDGVWRYAIVWHQRRERE